MIWVWIESKIWLEMTDETLLLTPSSSLMLLLQQLAGRQPICGKVSRPSMEQTNWARLTLVVLAAAVANGEFDADDDALEVAGLESIANGNLHRINRLAATRGGFSGGKTSRGGANMGRFQPPMNHRNHNGGAASQPVPFYDPTYVDFEERLEASLLTAPPRRPMARPRDERHGRVTHPRDSYQVNPDAVSTFGALQPPGGGGTKRWSGSPKSGAPAPPVITFAGSGPSNARPSNARLVANVCHQTGPSKPTELAPHQRPTHRPAEASPHQKAPLRPSELAPHQRASPRPAEMASHQRVPPRPAESTSPAFTSQLPDASAGLTFHLDVKGKIEELKTTSYVRVFAYEHPSRETDILEIHQSTGEVLRDDIRSLINPFDNGGGYLTIRRKGLDGIIKAIKIRFADNQAVTMVKNVLLERFTSRKTSTAPRYPDLVFEGIEFGVVDVSSILAFDEQPTMTAAQPSMAVTASEQVATTDKTARPVDPNPVLLDLNPEASEEPEGIIDFGIKDSEKTAVSALTELFVLMAPPLEDVGTQKPLINFDPEDSPEKPQRPLAPHSSSISDLEGIKF